MAELLTAPITEAEYKVMPLLPMAPEMVAEKAIMVLNQAWATVQTLCDQPLALTSNTDVYDFPSRYCNIALDGALHILPKFQPVVSLSNVYWSPSPALFGWTASTMFDLFEKYISVYDQPWVKSEHGHFKIIYTSGYATTDPKYPALKALCGQMTAHLLSGGYTPTVGGMAVLSEYLNKDFWNTLQKFKRVI